MKATFRKTITAKAFMVFAKIRVAEKREDIQQFLRQLVNSTVSYEDRVAKRICKYLQSIHLLNNDGTLTKSGEEVVETAIVFHPEEGKYIFWCIDEELIGNYLVALKRERPESGKFQDTVFSMQKIEKHSGDTLIIASKKEGKKWKHNAENNIIRVSKVGNGVEPLSKQNSKLELKWEWQDFEESKYRIVGEINDHNHKHRLNLHFQKQHPLENIFADLLRENNYEWDRQQKAIKVYFENTTEQVRENFVMDLNLNKGTVRYGSFDSITFQDVKVIPIDDNSATSWRNWRIERWLEDQYVNNEQFTQKVEEENQRFPSFHLYDIDAKYFIKILQPRGLKTKPKSFWHLAATHDLNPGE